MDEFDWINPIVIYNKKDIDDVRVCVDFNTLNSKCIHNPFPTPFSDEVLNQVSWKEVYSCTNGFLDIICIVEEYKKKTIFAIFSTKWGFFSCNVMPFGLKNALIIFLRVVIVDFRD